MKRPGPLSRKTPLQRRTPLKRGAPLKRRRKHVPLAIASLSRELQEAWAAATGTVCEVCGATSAERRIEGHHIVRQFLIRDASATHKWDGEFRARMLWDLRNKLDLCERCHRRHHRRLGTLAWSLIERLKPAAVEFAKQVDLLWRAKLDYDLEGDDGDD